MPMKVEKGAKMQQTTAVFFYGIIWSTLKNVRDPKKKLKLKKEDEQMACNLLICCSGFGAAHVNAARYTTNATKALSIESFFRQGIESVARGLL